MRVLRDMNEAVLVLDHGGYIVYLNKPASEVLEMDPVDQEEKVRFPVDIDQKDNDDFYECVMDALYRKDEVQFRQVRYITPSGRKYWFRMSSSYLADGDGELVITLADETRTAELQERIRESSKTFSAFLFVFSAWMVVYALWEFLSRPAGPDLMTHGVELIGLLMFLYITRYTKLTRQDLGLEWEGMGKIRTGVVIALLSVVFLFALKGILRLFDPGAFSPQAPFFDVRAFGWSQVVYVFTAGIQEFLARSVIQGNLRRIMPEKHAKFSAIALSSLIFAALHIHLGFLFMIGAAILAGLVGILYEKERSVYCVWIVHWVFGVAGTMLHLI